MSSDVVIRAEGLGKKYVIGHQAERQPYVALRDVVARSARSLGRTALDLVRGRPSVGGDEVEDFWALKDVSFEIRRGDVVGVIGRNGAGKSTLLKVLSRITEPTEGRVEIRGRVASLLAVGAGVHPELTGRENIYLNGAILGMERAEIRRKFDEIVAFADVEKFLDTPLKRYSSGMYVRLGFAVAAHLEPEILIVDEVLAVGDADFQRKCLGKMGEVARHGRTVLFVSHNMAAIEALCGSGILLSQGSIAARDDIGPVIATYARSIRATRTWSDALPIQRGLTLSNIGVGDNPVVSGEPAHMTFEFSATEPVTIYECAIIISSEKGERIAVVDPRADRLLPHLCEKDFSITASISALPLVEGDYVIGLNVRTTDRWEELTDVARFRVEKSAKTPATVIPPEWRGCLDLHYKTELH